MAMRDLAESLRQASGLLERGEPAQSESVLALAVREFPASPDAFFLLGVALHRLGRLDEAIAKLSECLRLAPAHLQAANARAAVLSGLGRDQEAHDAYRILLDKMPENAQLLGNLAFVLERLGRLPEALIGYDEALICDHLHYPSLLNRGGLLLKMGILDKALENNERLVAAFPKSADAQFNLAEVLLSLGRPAQALQACERALQVDPGHYKAMIDKGLALSELGRLQEADIAFSTVRSQSPHVYAEFVNVVDPNPSQDPGRFDPELIYLSRAYEKLNQCDWSGRDGYLNSFVKILSERLHSGRKLKDKSLAYNSLTLPVDQEFRFAIARQLSAEIEMEIEALRRPEYSFGRRDRKRLRVGYLSPDIREHLNAYLLRPVLQLHDRQRFEVFCYSLTPDDKSSIRGGIESAADDLRDVSHLGTDRIADMIYRDQIDILMDVGGFTTFSRPMVFALRPAPIQVSYLAFPGTLAAAHIPYRITDRTATPAEQVRWWGEKLVYLPRTFFPYDQFERLPDVVLSRAEYGLPEDAFVFCCFNNLYKIEPSIFGVWMDLLRAVPTSVLWLSGRNAEAVGNLKREAQARGVSAGRLIFAPFESRDRYAARFRLADLFLDTPIFNAMTTACDALRAGLPLLTVAGEAFPSRVATSVVRAAGFEVGITGNMDEYKRRALEWATRPDQLLAHRRQLQANRARAPLFDTRSYVRHLERAFQTMWERHQRGQPPESFDVPETRVGFANNRWY
jgi:protein O-GlcNAc transferase